MVEPLPKLGGATAPKSFLQALGTKPAPLFSSLPASPHIKPITSYKGDIALIISEEDMVELASHYKNALIGKFPRGKPAMENLNVAFRSIGFKSNFQIGSIDYRHILIRFQDMEDYHRCWLKGLWNFNGAPMKVLKWTPDFSPEAESSIVPVWATIKDVPFFWYNSTMIEEMGNQIGKYIKMDAETATLSQRSVIKICVEVDVQAKLHIYIRMGTDYENGKFPIEYENLPLYCSRCRRLGHDLCNCRIQHPELRNKDRTKPGSNHTVISAPKGTKGVFDNSI